MKKKKMMSLTMALVLGTMGLTGCSNNRMNIPTEAVEVKTSKNLLEYYIEKPKSETKGPGEHVFFKRYYAPKIKKDEINSMYIYKMVQGSIRVPYGYEILDINTISENNAYSNPSNGIDVWFKNTERVIVEPVYNEKTGLYDYSDFGMIDLIDYGEINPTIKK